MSPGSASQPAHRRAEGESLAELFCDVFRLVDARVAGVTDLELNERLQLFLWSAGYTHPAEASERRMAAFGRAWSGMSARPSSSGAGAALALIPSLVLVPDRESAPDVDAVICELYSIHYRPLVRLAGMLVRDTATAEEVVQDAFVAVHAAWPRLRDSGKALSYLRQSVVNRSRSVLRHRAVADKYVPHPSPQAPATEQAAITRLERSAVVAALRRLPARQREALALRYYAGLSEADIAKAMGISRGAVKSHTTRGKSALRAILDETT